MYTNNMEYTYTHTLALNSVPHYITYPPPWKQSFPHLTQASGNCLLQTKKALILSRQNGISGSHFLVAIV